MTRSQIIAFTLWALSHHDEGASLTHERVADHYRVDRSTAYRLLSDYFDARGWVWPRIENAGGWVSCPRRKMTKAERYAAFNHPNPQARRA